MDSDSLDPLLPPPQAIHERLTRNQRERRRLRALLRLVNQETEDKSSPPAPLAGHVNARKPRQTAAGREVDHAS